jgi:hypothetical protein
VEQIKNLLSQFELNEPVSEIEIMKVEEQLNVKFPQGYNEFLLLSNGGGVNWSIISSIVESRGFNRT